MPDAQRVRWTVTVYFWLPLAVGVAVALSLLRFTPEVGFWKGIPIDWVGAARVPAIVAQFRDPLGWSAAAAYSKEPALSWRLLMPLAGRALGLTTQQYLALPWLGALWALGLTGWYAWKDRGDRQRAIIAVMLAATSAVWFMATSCLGLFDGFFLVALLACAFSPSLVVATVACLCGPWLDERFLLVLPFALALRASRPDVRWWAPALGVAPYGLIRLWSVLHGDPSVGNHVALQSSAFGGYFYYLPVGWWYGFRLGWVAVGRGMLCCWRQSAGISRLAFVLGLVGVGFIGFFAWDSTRSIVVMLPFLVIGTARFAGPVRVLWGLALLNLIVPAAFVSALVAPGQVQNTVVHLTTFLFRP